MYPDLLNYLHCTPLGFRGLRSQLRMWTVYDNIVNPIHRSKHQGKYTKRYADNRQKKNRSKR